MLTCSLCSAPRGGLHCHYDIHTHIIQVKIRILPFTHPVIPNLHDFLSGTRKDIFWRMFMLLSQYERRKKSVYFVFFLYIYGEISRTYSLLSDFVPIDLEEWWAQRFLANIVNLSWQVHDGAWGDGPVWGRAAWLSWGAQVMMWEIHTLYEFSPSCGTVCPAGPRFSLVHTEDDQTFFFCSSVFVRMWDVCFSPQIFAKKKWCYKTKQKK